jgi:hypothetical protein
LSACWWGECPLEYYVWNATDRAIIFTMSYEDMGLEAVDALMSNQVDALWTPSGDYFVVYLPTPENTNSYTMQVFSKEGREIATREINNSQGRYGFLECTPQWSGDNKVAYIASDGRFIVKTCWEVFY